MFSSIYYMRFLRTPTVLVLVILERRGDRRTPLLRRSFASRSYTGVRPIEGRFFGVYYS